MSATDRRSSSDQHRSDLIDDLGFATGKLLLFWLLAIVISAIIGAIPLVIGELVGISWISAVGKWVLGILLFVSVVGGFFVVTASEPSGM